MLSSFAEMESAAEHEERERINQPEVRKRIQNRLSQRRHSEYPEASIFLLTLYQVAECSFQGDKVRQQREPLAQEIMIPPSFTSASTTDGGPGPSDYQTHSLSFNARDDWNDSVRSNQLPEGYDSFGNFNANDILPSDPTSSNMIMPPAQPGSMRMTRSMTPHTGRLGTNDSFQSNNMRRFGSIAPSTPSVPADSQNEAWDSSSLSDSQWAIPGYHHKPSPLSNPPTSTNNRRSTSSQIHDPLARPMSRRFSSASSKHQMNALPSPRTSDFSPSPTLQRNMVDEAYYPSSNHLGNGNARPTTAKANHEACSHCRTCRAISPLADQKPENDSTRSPTSTLTQDSSQDNLSDHHEILANCSKVLASLARQSEYRDEDKPEKRPRSSKRNQNNREGDFADSGRSLHEDDSGDERCQRSIVEKVVILCVNNVRKKVKTKGM